MIVTYARAGHFDLLLAGYHGHSRIFDRLIGSTAESIVRLSPCSVLLAK
jgi:nucleotide-binding universal stress UspA family protein